MGVLVCQGHYVKAVRNRVSRYSGVCCLVRIMNPRLKIGRLFRLCLRHPRIARTGLLSNMSSVRNTHTAAN